MPFDAKIKEFKIAAKHSNQILEITDFGAGSKKLGRERRLKDIYKTSVASDYFQRFIFQLIQSFDSENILEMGTSLGFTTAYLAAATKGKVTTVEACPATYQEASSLFRKLQINNLAHHNCTFVVYFEEFREQKYDFVYIDGHHDGTALLQYIEILKPQLSNKAVLLIDDIRWSKDMLLAWQTLVKDPFFSQTIDVFRMGVLSR